MFTLPNTSGILGYETDESGLLTKGRINAVPPAGLDTTTLTYAVGCQITNQSNGQIWENVGTSVSPSWVAISGPKVISEVTINLATADIILATTGHLSHSQGLIVVPAAPTGFVNQFISGTVSFTAGPTPFTGGGNTTFNIGGGGSAITGLIGTPTLWDNASSVVQQFVPLSTVAFPVTKETSINLVTASAILNATGGGGSAKVSVLYRQLPL